MMMRRLTSLIWPLFVLAAVLLVRASITVDHNYRRGDDGDYRRRVESVRSHKSHGRSKHYSGNLTACRALGFSVKASYSAKYEKLHEVHRHNFQFPPAALPDAYICVPAKNGNHNWRGFFHQLWYGHPPHTLKELETGSKTYTTARTFSDRKDRLWLLTRSPYVRLLSIYLEKVMCSGGITQYGGDEDLHMFRYFGNVTFEQFVVGLTNHVLFGRDPYSAQLDLAVLPQFYKDHRQLSDIAMRSAARQSNAAAAADSAGNRPSNKTLAKLPTCHQPPMTEVMGYVDPYRKVIELTNNINKPNISIPHALERGARLCAFDHHTCIQAAALFKLSPGHMKVLRLEEQGRWFPVLAQCAGIRPQDVIGKEWMDFSGQPCFYTATKTCADALVPQEKVGLTPGRLHPRGTLGLMAVHYTPTVARLVHFLYEYDFLTLRYHEWDGISLFPNN